MNKRPKRTGADAGTAHQESLRAVIRKNKAKLNAEQHEKDIEELRLAQDRYFKLVNS